MQLAVVRGSVTSTIKHSVYNGEKLVLLQAVEPDLKPRGSAFVAIDRAQAGAGDTVLYIDEGNSARMVLETEGAPARAVVVGIVDQVDFNK